MPQPWNYSCLFVTSGFDNVVIPGATRYDSVIHVLKQSWCIDQSFRRSKPRTEQENPMFYGNTKSLLESIVRGLKNEPPQNDADWQAQTDLVQACLAEMVEMSKPAVNPSMGATARYVHRPVADKLNRAMPYVRSMLTAMRDRDGTTALAHGETTLRRL